jgi:gliding motility-associated protein GldM
MINIMYLVLTALLALNVSAEIFNAFKVVDKGLVDSNIAYDRANEPLPNLITEGAKKKPEYQKYADRVPAVRQASKEFTDYVQGLIDYMIDHGGNKNGVVDDGDYETYKGVTHLRGQKDKDITTRYLVNGEKGVPGKGEELKAKIEEYRQKFLAAVDPAQQAAVDSKIPLRIDDESWKHSLDKSKKTWSDFNFRQMPLQATLPILNKFINDAKASEATVLNYLLEQVGTSKDVVLDKFAVVSAPEKSYVIKGETYKTELFLGAAAGAETSNTRVSISVNGQSLPMKDGVATWTTPAAQVGVRKYTAIATVTNPVTNEVTPYKREFEFEVGERSVSVSPTKMNVFYIGVDNPVEVSAAGVPSNQVNVSMTGSGGGSISRNSDGTFNVKVTTPTKLGEFARIAVTAPGLNAGKDFRVKRIPDPVARLSTKAGGGMSPGEFKAQQGVGAFLDNFDFDAKCNIEGFQLVRVAKRADPEFATNKGARYIDEAQRLIDKATAGDRYFFDNVKARCPGDPAGREINSMVFTIR